MARLSKQELEELQSPDAWEVGGEVVQPSPKPARAVVSVALPREDFEAVVETAKRLGMKTSEFMRQAAIEKARPKTGEARVLAVTGQVFTRHVLVSAPRTKIDTTTKVEPAERAVCATT